MTGEAARAGRTVWDREYAAGRGDGEAPSAFVEDILAAADGMTAASPGLYIGCGTP
jgi:hypothetical protein